MNKIAGRICRLGCNFQTTLELLQIIIAIKYYFSLLSLRFCCCYCYCY